MAEADIPLWQLLRAASTAVQGVRGGRSLDTELEQIPARVRPGAQALAFHVLRDLGRAMALRQRLASRAPPPAVDALLCSALALLWDPLRAPYEAFTLVDQAVEVANRDRRLARHAGLVNACLRRFLRERDSMVEATGRDEVAVWNHPVWWIARVRSDHPAHWESILRAPATQPSLVLRVNVRRTSQAAYLRVLEEAGIEARPLGPCGVVLLKARPVTAIPGFAEGLVSVQDAAAQLAAPLLLEGRDAGDTLRVLDACAAPGGKTAHLLETSDAQVTALDVSPARCERVQGNLQRLGLSARVVAGDALEPGAWWDGQLFDAILLDAPCTASGIVRRHPDIPWLRRESDIAALGAIQAGLLRTLWPLLRPGGRLLYCTCSVFRAEGQDPIQTFVAHNTDAVLRPSPGHLLPRGAAKPETLPDNLEGEHDGFFYALLEKGPR